MSSKKRPPAKAKSRAQTAARPERPPIPATYLLLGLGLVVFVVSMPRFRAQVIQDNTAGARESLLLVGEVAQERGHRHVAALLADEVSLRHRMRDARPAGTDGRMRYHGYLIDEVTLEDGASALAAWPVDYGRTGRDAWIVTDDGRTYRHPNSGRWTGAARPLARVDLRDGWRVAQSGEPE
ncbi:MAG: hypothetical protein R3F49_20310 [Planctomycetota bacterium]